MCCRTVRSLKSFRAAVENLKLHDPVLFGKLSESTVRGWFEPGSHVKLTENTLNALKRGSCFYKPEASGKPCTLANFPNIRGEIVDLLQSLRLSGIFLQHQCLLVFFLLSF